MYRKLLMLTLLLGGNLILASLYSCEVDDGCNFAPVNNYCSNADRLSVEVYTNHKFEPVTQGNPVKATDVILYVYMHGSRTICYLDKKPTNNPFITSSYACSPPIPSYALNDKVTAVNITADKDFNSNYPKGSSLNDVFRMPLLSSINISGGEAYNSGQIIGQNNYYLDALPQQAGDYVFTITYTFESGKTLSISTAPISLSL